MHACSTSSASYSAWGKKCSTNIEGNSRLSLLYCPHSYIPIGYVERPLPLLLQSETPSPLSTSPLLSSGGLAPCVTSLEPPPVRQSRHAGPQSSSAGHLLVFLRRDFMTSASRFTLIALPSPSLICKCGHFCSEIFILVPLLSPYESAFRLQPCSFAAAKLF